MFKSSKLAVSVALALGWACSATALQAASSFSEGVTVAREAGEVRGEGKGHKRFDDATVIAREAGEVRGEGKGHKRFDDAAQSV